MNIPNFKRKIQTKLNNFLSHYSKKFDKSRIKFISDITNGLLRSKHIHLAKIASFLDEDISPQKTEERLSYHLKKENLYKDLQNAHIQSNLENLYNQKYIIFDGSDIVKEQAEKMEGLAHIRDGSKSGKKLKISNGYYWENVVGINEKDGSLFPIYSEIFSKHFDKDYKKSENMKIRAIYNSIKFDLNPSSVLVMDRGYDRRTIIAPLLDNDQQFIIRQTGRRNLLLKNKSLGLKKIYSKIKYSEKYKIIKNNHGKISEHSFKVGAIKVEFPEYSKKMNSKKQLWLVTAKEENKGFVWFLCNFESKSKKEVIKSAMEGYSYRWKIEEFHRQVKQEFSLESMKYIKYNSIKSIGSILLITMGFIATFFNNLSIQLKEEILIRTRQLRKNRIKDAPKFIYYKATRAICKILASSNYKRKKNDKMEIYNDNQLYLFM